jgi:hypothetical protein
MPHPQLFGKLNEYLSDDLEIMATLVFIERTNPTTNRDEPRRRINLVNSVKGLKTQFSQERIRRNLRIFGLLKNF